MTGMQRELWHIGMRPGDYLNCVLFSFRQGLNHDKWLSGGSAGRRSHNDHHLGVQGNDARALGASHVVLSPVKEAMKAAANRFST